MFEVVLWWCVWGEAANMRFMPEFLSFVFYSLLLKRPAGGSVDAVNSLFGKYEEGGGFLRAVIRPMYNTVEKEAFKKDKAGNNVDHSQKKNLDDFNEYFWRKGCRTIPLENVDSMATVCKQLEGSKKTYVERRGLLHSFKSNLRVFALYCCLFHLIVVIAHYVPFEQDALPLCPPQLRSDVCLPGKFNQTICQPLVGCAWGVLPVGNETQKLCYDKCTYAPKEPLHNDSSSNDRTQKRNEMSCTSEEGCKWDPLDLSCHIYSSRSPTDILADIDKTTYFSCDQVTGICRYKDVKGIPIEYSCTQHLSKGGQRTFVELNDDR